jgi:hypothetical protein
MYQARGSQNIRYRTTLLLSVSLFLSLIQARESLGQSPGHDISHRSEEEVLAAERALLEGFSDSGLKGSPDTDLSPQRPIGRDIQTLNLLATEEANASPSKRIIVKKNLARRELGTSETTVAPTPQRYSQSGAGPTKSAASSAPSPEVVDGGTTLLRRELEASQRRVSELERHLEELKGQLTMAETELSRMATLSEARNRASLGRISAPQTETTKRPEEAAPPSKIVHTEAPAPEPLPASNDLMIVTVAVDKAELRLGPGKNHSALMAVGRGSRLAVEARQGEWYRVFAPNGQRAWVLSRVVTVGDKLTMERGNSAVRVKGYSSSLEDEAFRRVQAITAGQ